MRPSQSQAAFKYQVVRSYRRQIIQELRQWIIQELRLLKKSSGSQHVGYWHSERQPSPGSPILGGYPSLGGYLSPRILRLLYILQNLQFCSFCIQGIQHAKRTGITNFVASETKLLNQANKNNNKLRLRILIFTCNQKQFFFHNCFYTQQLRTLGRTKLFIFKFLKGYQLEFCQLLTGNLLALYQI